MSLPELRIGSLVAKVPIVQGGMGVGISLSSLAGNVSLNGGIGVISGVEIGFDEPDYFVNKKEANIRALREHIKRAKEISKNGIIGINIMAVLNNFEEMVRESIREKIDIIFSGAGLPLSLPKFTKDTSTKIAPIVSSSRTASIICRNWDKHYQVAPDAIVVEGPKAGGHLGFSMEGISDPSNELEVLVGDVLKAIKPFEEKYNKKIPVIAGGGVFNGADIGRLLKAGASGVQIGSRFAATDECDASYAFKQAYVQCTSNDIELIQSPVGMIGRAIKNDFLAGAELGFKKPIKCITNCLKPCNPKEAQYCIASALINAQKGDLSSGFVFAGVNARLIKKIVPVKELMGELVKETTDYLVDSTNI